MTRKQAFWLLVAAAVCTAGYQMFTTPNAAWQKFMEAPPVDAEVSAADVWARVVEYLGSLREPEDTDVPDTDSELPSVADAVAEAVQAEPAPAAPPPAKAKTAPPKAKSAPPAASAPPPPPPVSTGPSQEEYAEDVRAKIRSGKMGGLQQCYVAFLRIKNPRAEGDIGFLLEISEFGRISDVSLTSDGLRDVDGFLRSCISTQLEGFRVGTPPGSRSTSIPYVLSFRLPDDWQRGGR